MLSIFLSFSSSISPSGREIKEGPEKERRKGAREGGAGETTKREGEEGGREREERSIISPGRRRE